MKRILTLGLAVILCLGILSGCGTNYSADESTVFIGKNGKIVSTDVEDFDASAYDEAELKDFVNQEIKDYVAEHGKNSVKLKKLKVSDGKAVLTLTYGSAEDYAQFNGVAFFAGTVAEALAAGYSFDGDFASITDGKAAEASFDSFKDEEGLKVVVINNDVNVSVNGTISYTSVNGVSVLDKALVAIGDDKNVFNGKTDGTEAVEVTETEAVETTTEAVEITSEDAGSVSEDELLAESTQEEVEFNFDEDGTDNAVTSGYKYIIYK